MHFMGLVNSLHQKFRIARMKILSVKKSNICQYYLTSKALWPKYIEYHSGRFIWANSKISNTFSLIFPSFVYVLSTKLWLSGLEHLASFWEVSGFSTSLNFDFFLSQFKFQIFRHFTFFLKFS